MNPATLAFRIVDLSPFVNRALADEEADDGKGGWVDQGSGYDMQGLDTGRFEHEGVPYDFLNTDTHRASVWPQTVGAPANGRR